MDKFEKLFAEYPWTLSDEAVKEAAADILAKHFDENNNVCGIETNLGTKYAVKAVIIATGTYLKGKIMKRRGWLEQAYENFSQAYRMNPNKAEYKYAYENMNNSQYGGYRTRRRAEKNNNNGCTGDCGACDICSGLICADCCCECMGGDLIRCC